MEQVGIWKGVISKISMVLVLLYGVIVKDTLSFVLGLAIGAVTIFFVHLISHKLEKRWKKST